MADRPLAQALVPEPLVEAVARRFKLLSAPARLALLNALHTGGEQSVQQLVEATGQRQASVSKHLKRLRRGGLVARRQDGLHAFYRVADPTLAALCLLVSGQVQQEGG